MVHIVCIIIWTRRYDGCHCAVGRGGVTCEIPLAPECTQDYVYDCGGHGYCIVDDGEREYYLLCFVTTDVLRKNKVHVTDNFNNQRYMYRQNIG